MQSLLFIRGCRRFRSHADDILPYDTVAFPVVAQVALAFLLGRLPTDMIALPAVLEIVDPCTVYTRSNSQQ